MNSGGAHCLKYGVTTNNVLGVKMVMMDGEIVEIGGAHLDAEGYDLLGLIVGSEGQFGIVTEATVRILRAAEGARPMLIGFESSAKAGHLRGAHHRVRHHSGRHRVHGQARDRGLRGVRQGRLSDRCRGAADHRGRGLGTGDCRPARVHRRASPRAQSARRWWSARSAEQSARIWKGRKSAFGAIGRISDYYCMDGTIPLAHLPHVLEQIAEICAQLRAARRQHLPCRRRQPAPAGHVRRQQARARRRRPKRRAPKSSSCASTSADA